MSLKRLLPVILAAFLGAGSVNAAAISVDFTAQGLKNLQGSPMARDGLVLVLASTQDESFGDLARSWQQFTAEADDRILLRFSTTSPGEALASLNEFALGTRDITAGAALLLVWYPGLDPSAAAPGVGQSFGTFRTEAVADGSTIGWRVPDGGGVADSLTVSRDLVANLVTVPEPGVVALTISAGVLLGLRRRKKRR